MPTTDQILRRIRFRPYRSGHGPTFSLLLWDTYRTDSRSASVLGYRLTMRKGRKHTVLFEGEDFGASPCHAIDSNDAVLALMSFLTLRPGDTDSEYFESYTAEQLEYCSLHAEALYGHAIGRFEN